MSFILNYYSLYYYKSNEEVIYILSLSESSESFCFLFLLAIFININNAEITIAVNGDLFKHENKTPVSMEQIIPPMAEKRCLVIKPYINGINPQSSPTKKPVNIFSIIPMCFSSAIVNKIKNTY